MSFQHFRLHPITPHAQAPTPVDTLTHDLSPSSLSQALGPTQSHSTPQTQGVPNHHGSTFLIHHLDGPKKGPYGSGDADDGYTLVFESMEAFQAWRLKEEEEKVVEFVKGDTHASKAVPPRFKDHTKLVCARHTRSGRKKYVKKFPERVRKVPSRKLEGQGCPASISYKTYFDSDEVRACYVSEHSHEIGLANLPFTKRGRKAHGAQQPTPTRARSRAVTEDVSNTPNTPGPSSNAVAGPSTPRPPDLRADHTHHPPSPAPVVNHVQPQTFQAAIAMLVAPHQPQLPQAHLDLTQERWERMSVLFQGIREHARNFEFPAPSVAALESVLIRLYLEAPVINGGTINGG